MSMFGSQLVRVVKYLCEESERRKESTKEGRKEEENEGKGENINK